MKKKNSIVDYAAYTLFKVTGVLLRCLPVGFSFFIGRRLGELFYFLDPRHRSLVYANLKLALGKGCCPAALRRMTLDFYRTFVQNLIEVFLVPLIDKEYLKRYVIVEGLEHIAEAFKEGKGVIFAAVHAGGWEVSNVVCANLGFSFNMFVRDQPRYPLVDGLLNSYRAQKGCKLIQRQYRTRQLVTVLKNNEAIGMTIDQGGRDGVIVKFFGRNASMSSGPIRLALKYETVILPAFFVRKKGPYVKIVIGEPFKIKRTGDDQKDLYDNLQRLVSVQEEHIRRNPAEYLWTYKVWKYGDERNILILSDAKAGHLRQAEAAAKISREIMIKKGFKVNIETVAVSFKSNLAKSLYMLAVFFSGKYACQGCLFCLRSLLEPASYEALCQAKPDLVISCGSSLAGINYLICCENRARSVVILKPSFLGAKRFNLVVMPGHDRPPRKKNIIKIEGALNLVDSSYLKRETDGLIQRGLFKKETLRPAIGLLFGGDTRVFHLENKIVLEVIKQVKFIAQTEAKDILVTTSRRTSREIELLVKREFKDYPAAKLLIIANDNNIPEAVGGILGLSEVVVVSPESISMVSEAVNSAKHVLVFNSPGLDPKHKLFLNNFSGNNYIRLVEARNLGQNIEEILSRRPLVKPLQDHLKVAEGLEKIL